MGSHGTQCVHKKYTKLFYSNFTETLQCHYKLRNYSIIIIFISVSPMTDKDNL